MMRNFLCLMACCLLPILLPAQVQTPYKITASSGTQTLGGNIVTVNSSGYVNYNTGSGCGADPYMIGYNPGGSQVGSGSYTYTFAAPVDHIQLHMVNIEDLDDIQFVVDGALFPLSYANLTPWASFCPNKYFTGLSITAGHLTSKNVSGAVQIDIQPAQLVHSIEVFNGTNMGAGANYDIYFMNDNIFIAQPFHDTSFCPGDTFTLNYNTGVPFPPGNVFTAYLSDSTGSFQHQIAIGSLTSNVSGGITCTIPPNIPTGKHYRVRIYSPTETSADDQLDIHIKPIPRFSLTGKTSLCQQDTLNWSVPVVPGVDYEWILANSNTHLKHVATISIPHLDTFNSGAYYITATLNKCVYTDTVQVVVKKLPPPPQAVSPSPVCAGDTVQLVANGTAPGGTYDWEGPGGYSSTLQSPVINHIAANAGGHYKVTLTQNGCVATDSALVVVHPTPRPTATNDGPVCIGNNLKLSLKDIITGVSYTWSGPDSFTSNQQNIEIYKIHGSGGGYYKVYAVTSFGCHATDSTMVVLKPGAEAPIPAVDSISCLGDTLQLSITNTDSAAAYHWLGSGGFNGYHADTSFVPKLTGPLVFQVFAMKNGCTSGGDTISVNVNPKPRVPTASSNSPVKPGKNVELSALSSTPGVSYSWTGPNNFSSTEQNPVIANAMPTLSGKYFVTATVNGCSSSAQVSVSVGTSADRPYIIYPNPTNGSLRIIAQVQKDQEVGVMLSDIAGQRIFYEEIPTQNNLLNTTIDLPGSLASGIYQLSITVDGSINTDRIVLHR